MRDAAIGTEYHFVRAVSMKFTCIMKSALVIALATSLPARAADEPQRPHILGISHFALFVHDMAKSRQFYKQFLGFDEPYSLNNPDGTLHMTWIKINDQQSIELLPEKEANSDRLYHFSLQTDDVAGMRDYLASRGVEVPAKPNKGRIGNLEFFIKDPNGHTVEIVQYEPDGWTMANKGKFMPDTRISTYMPHVGILVDDVDVSKKFYEDVLGFKEIWRGSKNGKELNWVHERLPDSKEFIEFMLYSQLPDPDKRGKYHHFCLEVPDIKKAKGILDERAAAIGYDKPMTIQVGINRKRQLNVYDPDGTRVEFMEPFTIDHIPAPPSTAPAPHPTQQAKNQGES